MFPQKSLVGPFRRPCKQDKADIPNTFTYYGNMSSTPKQLFDDAMQLPDDERAALAARLIESLEPAPDQDAQAAWDSEIQRRLEELENGQVTPIPWSKARQMILGVLDGPAAS